MSFRSIALGLMALVSFPGNGSLPDQGADVVPLARWQAPLSWLPDAAPSGPLKSAERGIETASSLPTDPIPFVAITPCRLIDTRGLSSPTPPYPLPVGYGSDAPLVAGGTRDYQVAGTSHCSVPAGARAVSANVTVLAYSADGYVTAFPPDVAQPFVATMNWRTSVNMAQNAGILELGAAGAMRVYASAFAKIVVDVNGYYAPNAGSGLFAPASPGKRFMELLANFNTGSLSNVGMGAPSIVTVGSSAPVDSDGPWFRFMNQSSSGPAVVSNYSLLVREWDPEATFRVKTQTVVSNVRLWVGLFSGSPASNDVNSNLHLVAFRSAPAAGDTAWQFCTSDGSTQSCNSTGVPVAANTAYTLSVVCDSSAGSCTGYVNGSGTVRTLNLPDPMFSMGYAVSVESSTGVGAFALGRVTILHK